MIPLVSAERAWSQAMELKAQLEKEAISYKRQHMVSLPPAQCMMSEELPASTPAEGGGAHAMPAAAFSEIVTMPF